MWIGHDWTIWESAAKIFDSSAAIPQNQIKTIPNIPKHHPTCSCVLETSQLGSMPASARPQGATADGLKQHSKGPRDPSCARCRSYQHRITSNHRSSLRWQMVHSQVTTLRPTDTMPKPPAVLKIRRPAEKWHWWWRLGRCYLGLLCVAIYHSSSATKNAWGLTWKMIDMP